MAHHLLHLGGMLGGADQVQAVVFPGLHVGNLAFQIKVFLPTDLAVRRVLTELGGSVESDPERWRPWRSYALHHLWASL